MTDHIERGAQEEESGAPLTETEVEASRRPPSQPDDDTTTPGAAPAEAAGADPADE